MTLQQVKTLLIGVLKGWFTNKKVLDKFSEDTDGTLLYNGAEVGGEGDSFENADVLANFSEEGGKLLYKSKTIECECATFTDSEITAAIAETLAALAEDDDEENEEEGE